ncbi:MAG: toprim domain-containing protein [Aquificae bacterium]|nr:toprim domain-containing protein [Aquificota bacterium]
MSFKDLKEWLRELRRASRSCVVIVEGKNDRRALERRGVVNILELSGKRFSDIPDILEGKTSRVILLLDLDYRGELAHKKIKELLLSQGFGVDEKFRNFLKKMNIIHIEELNDGEKWEVKNS